MEKTWECPNIMLAKLKKMNLTLRIDEFAAFMPENINRSTVRNMEVHNKKLRHFCK